MLNCINTDVCLPDYFSGDSRSWICVPIHSFRYTMTKKAQEDGKCYIAYIMDDFGNDVRVNTSKVDHFLAPLH